MTQKFETGATSHAINDLILFADNTRELAELRDSLYKKAVDNASLVSELPTMFVDLYHKTLKAYRTEFKAAIQEDSASPYDSLTKGQADEFCRLYADEFITWQKEHGFLPW